MSREAIRTVKVRSAEDRRVALRVVEEVYRDEKGWIEDCEAEIPENVEEIEDRSWFLCRAGDEPVGLIRLVYDPPLELPAELDVRLEPWVDLAALTRHRFVDIGRFMIRPAYRRSIRYPLQLIQAAVREMVERGYSHLLTDVYEGEPHSPLDFHTRVLGFRRVGTHRFGDLNCSHLRIILVLDVQDAYRRLKQKNNKVFREVGDALRDLFEPAHDAAALTA